MSRRRRRREAPMPVSSAGLLRFFEEEIAGVKVRPEMILIAAAVLIVVCVASRIIF